MKMIIAAILMLALLLGLHLYVASRVTAGMRLVLPKLGKGSCAVVCTIMLALLLVGFFRSMLPLSDGVKRVLGVVSMCWLGVVIYLLLYSLLADVALLPLRLLGKVTDRAKSIAYTLAVGLALATALGGFFHTLDVQVAEYSVKVANKQTKDMHIVLITDLHLGAINSENRLAGVVDAINAQNPDLVCIAGDFFDSDFAAIQDPERARAELMRLKAKYGVYACLGNHDAGSTYEKMVSFLDSCGITLLRDEYVVIDDALVLAGRRDGSPIGGADGQSREALPQILQGAPGELPVVVLDHNPTHVDTYGPETDLLLCGHTHKGQLFPGSLITGWMYTVDYGYYRKDSESPHVIVSSGVGYWGMPMRVGTDCELVSIHLTA